ncbi:MAG: DUF1302 domain-containing protein, partial [Gammaproteobacteria bacterium]|nr:DUF1302 domain-containing protein [Gammaproteobacteria bacterium]
KAALMLLALVVVCPLKVTAEETLTNEELEIILTGFEDSVPVKPVEESKNPEPDSRYSGFTQTAMTWNTAHDAPGEQALPGQPATDFRGLSQLQQSLYLQWESALADGWQFHISAGAFYDAVYSIHGRNHYTRRLLNKQEVEAELKQAWVQGGIGDRLDIKIGRQITIWGKSDNLRVADFINPLNRREPGMTDLENLRLPVAMMKLDYYLGAWGLSLIAVNESRGNKNSPYGSDFYPFPVVLPEEVKMSGEDYALAVNGRFPGWDIAFYAARFDDREPHWQAGQLIHSRLHMQGISASLASGNWLLKGELVRLHGLQFSSASPERLMRTDVLAGLEYSGWHEKQLSVEVAARHLHEFNRLLEEAPVYQRQNRQELALRYNQDFLRQTLHLVLVAVKFGPGRGSGFQRLELKYDVRDAVSISMGMVNYDDGQHPVFGQYGDNDRLFLKFRVSF